MYTVQLILNSEKSAMQIAKDLGINDKTIYNWIKVYKKEIFSCACILFEKKGNSIPSM
jgi:hypothetical protein